MDSKRLPIWIGALLGAGLCLSPATAVAQKHAASVDISPSDNQVQVGRTTPFVATAYDNTGNPIPTATFVYSSNNQRAATIDQNGIATGVGPGVAIITARTGSGRYAKSAQATLQVTGEGPVPRPESAGQPPVVRPPVVAPGGRLVGSGCSAAENEPAGSGPPVGLLVEPLRVTLVKGESKALAYRPVQGSGETADHLCVLFAIQPGGEKVAAVDSFGVVLAGSDTGHAVVQVTVPGKTFPPMHVAVEVRNDSVRFRAREISLVPGATDTLQLLVPAQGNRPINSAGIFQFVSSDTTKVRVAPLIPIVTALAPGTARVIAQSSVYPDIPITISVHRRVTRILVSPGDTLITLAIGAQTTLGARPLAADSSVVTEVPVSWSVSDTTIAHFDTATKVVRGLKMGDVHIRVTVPVANDTVIPRDWHVRVIAGGLAITRPGLKVALGVGERMPVEVKILDDKRQPIETASRLTWTSTSDSIARVVDGQIVGVGMGRARLTARAAWDSTVTTEVSVVGDLLVYALRQGRWDVYMLEHAPTGQPPAGQPPTGQPPAGQPPAVQPPTGQPPAGQPPAVQPPTGQPPAGQPPTAQPPAAQPPGAQQANGQPPKVRQLTQDSLIKSSPPAWSPTLLQIAYVAAPGVNGNHDLYVEDADGTSMRRLTHDSATAVWPSFVGPSGDQIVFESSKSGKAQLYEMKLDGTQRRQLTSGDNPNTQPNVSPDGRKVLYTSLRDRNFDIYEIGLDGTGERRLTNSPRPEDSPQYAADGRSFYYLRDEGGNPNTKRVYKQDLASSTVTPAAPGAPAAPAAPAAAATPITPVGMYVRSFSVSPDGSTLALHILTPDAHGVQTTAVVMFDVGTGVKTPVTLNGADAIGGPAFRPPTPQQH